MLELRKIKKSYKTGDFVQDALKGIDLSFRKNEFVAVLGQSGSGKTTMLNIIGGLDRYDGGDLIINNKSTKDFKDKDWDAYRNNCIGFVFQSYNLITHISVLANVEMGMTLSGINSSVRKKKASDALERVGLKEHMHKKPNQLSGGQMQRVAIARALANDPDIILADEPTGALDSETSVQIMELIQEIAQDKLVIMVTHNSDLAKEYANRTIELKDGEVQSDSNPILDASEIGGTFSIVKTSMSYITALKLSFNNILTKKGRTLLTSFASSIGIIGIALILSLSNGFQLQIDAFQQDSLSQMPITISKQAISLNAATMSDAPVPSLEKYTAAQEVAPQKNARDAMSHVNNITQEYIDYINKVDKTLIESLSMQSSVALNVINKNGDVYEKADLTTPMSTWGVAPTSIEGSENKGVLENNYDIIKGSIDNTTPGLILMVDANNQIDENYMKQLGLDTTKNVSFDDIMNTEVKVILNNDYYAQVGRFYLPNQDYQAMYNNANNITLKVQAIIRGKEGKDTLTSTTGIIYTQSLSDKVLAANLDSNIVKAQKDVAYNVLSGQPFDETATKEATLAYLGAEGVPSAISIYPKDFKSKDKIIEYLDAYNKDKNDADSIQYTDLAEMISSLTGNIMSAITLVLIAFSAISLVVSSIMIGIITYISVLERTKEIGILRALGARKKDITRVFNAETMIIGICSGFLGIGIALLLTIPANALIEQMAGLKNVAQLNPVHAFILIIISIVLTLIGGFIPAKMAAKKDPVEALRSE